MRGDYLEIFETDLMLQTLLQTRSLERRQYRLQLEAL